MIGGEDRKEDRKHDEEKYARLAARLLTERQAASLPDPIDVRRDAVVAAMALAIAGKARRRRIAAVSAVVFAIAASVVVLVRLTGSGGTPVSKPDMGSALVVEHASGHGNQLVRASFTQSLPERGVLAVGDSIRTGEDGNATIGSTGGTRITLSLAAHLRVDELGSTRRFSLLGGQFQAHVAKLSEGERFVVDTPDSEVEVRGTVFTVAVNGSSSTCRDSGSSSTVRVSEGSVWVRSGDKQVVLQPGETWATPCPEPHILYAPAAESAARAPAAESSASSARPAGHKAAVTRATTLIAPGPRPKGLVAAPSPAETALGGALAPPSVPASHLSEQNDLFSSAMTAERQGQHSLALRKLDELVARFPSGPLVESARAERQRIVSAQTPR